MSKLILIGIIIFSLFMLSCSGNEKKPPMAKNGVLDLRNWDFEKDGIIRLDGDWEFYWKQFLTSADFDTVRKKHFIQVPKPWNDYKWGKEELGYEGYATYRLRIIVNDKTKDFGLKFPDQGTAFELYLNDSLVGKNGKIGKSRETSEPQYKPLLIPFERAGDTITIVCQVSNYDFHFGGIYFASKLGETNEITSNTNKWFFLDFFFFASIITTSFLMFCFYVFRTKERTLLLISLFMLFVGLRVTTIGEKIITTIPDLSWELIIKIEGLTWFTFAPLLGYYLYDAFRKKRDKYSFIINSIIYIILGIITLFSPARINSQFLIFGQVALLSFCLFSLFTAIILIVNKNKNAIIVSLGLYCAILTAIVDVFYYLNLTSLFIPETLGLYGISITQFIAIAVRYSDSIKRVENYAKELKIEVEEKTKDLRIEKEKTDELYKKSEQLLLNVLPEQIAHRLKQGETPIADHFEDASVIFIDIADFTEMSDQSNPQDMVKMLNDIFSIFDKISAKYGLEKIKTIGDCYMAAAGIPVPRTDHAEAIAKMAVEVMDTVDNKFGIRNEELGIREENNSSFLTPNSSLIRFRIGLDCGPIVAGVIGEQKFIYDLWGDMVNTASRMETNGVIGKIQCTERFREKLLIENEELGIRNEELGIRFEERGEIEIKGKGLMKTYFLIRN